MGREADWIDAEEDKSFQRRRRGFGTARGLTPIQLMALLCAAVLVLMVVVGAPLLSSYSPKEAPPVAAEPKALAPAAFVDLYYPLRRIESGTLLEPDMFRKIPKARTEIPTLPGNLVLSDDQFVGRFSRVKLLPGTPLAAADIVDDIDNIIAQKLLPGYRAVTVKVDDVTGIEGWSTPGARVDVMWIASSGIRDREKAPDTIAKTIVTDAQILSVMGRTQSDGSGSMDQPRSQNGYQNNNNNGGSFRPQVSQSFTVTIGVRAVDGQKVALAATTGKIVLMLRGQTVNDADHQVEASISTSDLLGSKEVDNHQQVDGTVRVRKQDGTYDEFALVGRDLLKWDKGGEGKKAPIGE